MQSNRRTKYGIGFLVAGGLALALAWVLAGPGRESGDVAAVEAALRPTTTVAIPSDAGRAPAATPQPDPTRDPAENPGPAEDGVTPIGIRIPAISVDASVVPSGVDSSGQMEVPANVTDVAWYEYGPRPGESGSAVLAAHVDLAGQGRGVFYDLQKLTVGDTILVTGAEATEVRFRVVARTVYSKDTLPTDVVFSRDGPPVLTLITCGGGFSRGRYDSNVVVYAVPDDGSQPPRGSAL